MNWISDKDGTRPDPVEMHERQLWADVFMFAYSKYENDRVSCATTDANAAVANLRRAFDSGAGR